MKVLVFVCILLGTSYAKRLISTDELDALFKKALQKELEEQDIRNLHDVMEIARRSESPTVRSYDFMYYLRTTLDCVICRSAVGAFFELVRSGTADDVLISSVDYLCATLGIVSPDVCHGILKLNVPILSFIVRNTPAASPAVFCGLVVQSAGVVDNGDCPFQDERFEWQVELPPLPTEPVPSIQAPQDPLTIAIVSDAHLDPLYEPFGVAQCGAPTCCRKGQTLIQNYVPRTTVDESIVADTIVRSDDKLMLDLDTASKIRDARRSARMRSTTSIDIDPAGYWGDYRDCDTPIWAFDDVIDRIAEAHKDIDVIYYIGDTIDHGVWETTYDLINEMNLHVINKIRQSFGDEVLVVPTIGNHESQPTNQFAPETVTGEYLNTTWLYEGLANKWSFYLPEDAQQTLRRGGDFSVPVRPGLRAISLNSNVAYKMNWWLLYDPTDAKKHLDWLIQELYNAEQAGEKVHILTHIPPGVHDLMYTWTREYNRIVNRFSSTIAAEFTGHTHADEFKIYYDPQGRPARVAWGGGSATTYSFYNHNYKIATIDTQTYEPTNIMNFVYNMTEANLTPNRRPHWFQLYDMRNTFQLNDLSVQSMDDLVHGMVTDRRHLLAKYSAFVSKLNDRRWENCSEGCQLDHLCRTVVTVLWERQKCDELRQIFYS